MYIGNLAQWREECRTLPSFIVPWITYLAGQDLLALPVGRHELPDGNYLNIDEAETAPAVRRKMEAHCRYVDIQLLLEGTENIGYQPISDAGPVTEERCGADARFYEPPVADDLVISMVPKKTIAVFFPTDGHRCLCSPVGTGATVRKAILKVRLPE